MRSRIVLLCIVVAVTVFAVFALAADPEPAAPAQAGIPQTIEPTAGEPEANKAEGIESLSFQDPMMVQINALMTEADAELAKLQAQFDQATDDYEALAINRQIDTIKTDLELDILKLQADRARQTGRLDVAEDIDKAILEMTTPRPTKQPIDRPAPGVGNQ